MRLQPYSLDAVTRYLVRGKKWTPGPIFACEKWSARTKACSARRIGIVCALAVAVALALTLALALALTLALALARSTFGCHNWTPGPVFVRSTFCVATPLFVFSRAEHVELCMYVVLPLPALCVVFFGYVAPLCPFL